MNRDIYSRNLCKLKRTLRSGQIVPGKVTDILNDRDVLIKVQGLVIKAYTNLPFNKGDGVFLRIEQLEPQLRFKLMTVDEYRALLKGGIDFSI